MLPTCDAHTCEHALAHLMKVSLGDVLGLMAVETTTVNDGAGEGCTSGTCGRNARDAFGGRGNLLEFVVKHRVPLKVPVMMDPEVLCCGNSGRGAESVPCSAASAAAAVNVLAFVIAAHAVCPELALGRVQ